VAAGPAVFRPRSQCLFVAPTRRLTEGLGPPGEPNPDGSERYESGRKVARNAAQVDVTRREKSMGLHLGCRLSVKNFDPGDLKQSRRTAGELRKRP
jgi:hypothetical protein